MCNKCDKGTNKSCILNTMVAPMMDKVYIVAYKVQGRY